MMVPEFRDQPISLGQALAKVERGTGPGRGITEKKITGFTSFLRDLGMTKPTAMEAQRIGCMPDEEMARNSKKI